VATGPVERQPARVDEGGPTVPPRGLAAQLRDPETLRAVGMAGATMAANVVGLGFTLVFTRVLGVDGYGSLAALLNLSLILYVPGAALQVAVARQGALGRLGQGPEEAAVLWRWTRRLLAAIVVAALVAALAREPLAALLNVNEVWAAAAVPVTAGLWLVVSLQRGVLQGARAYRPVGLSIVLEAVGRLAAGAALALAGLDVTGAYLGTPIALAITGAILAVVVHRRLETGAAARASRGAAPTVTSLGELARLTVVPIAALTLVAALQNVDVLIARHVLPEDAAGVYAAATVAAKALVWIAVGIGLWLLPEAVGRAAAGGDPRPILGRALAVIAAVAVPALVLYATVPGTVLRIAFGAEFVPGAAILLPLGAAYALLAVTYLAVQYLLGLHLRSFLPLLAAAAVAEPVLLAFAGDLDGFAFTVLGVQAAVSVAVLALALRARPR
jgi:O-antigen/teichoic acid export membrane protein